MKSKEIDISQFNTINDIYEFVDKNVDFLEQNMGIVGLWLKYISKTTDASEEQISKWERDCFLFDIERGELFFSPIYSSTSETKEAKVIKYLMDRMENSSNPILKARYAHWLWKCPVGIKHNKFATVAIANYTKAIENCSNQYIDEVSQNTIFQIGELYKALLAVLNDINTDLETIKTKTLTQKLLFNSTFEFSTKFEILCAMLKYPKLFKPIDFKNTLVIFENELNNKSDFILINNYLPIAIKIATKTNSDVKKWHNEAGFAYLRNAETETQENRFGIKLYRYADAIHAFTLAGNEEKKKEAEYLYAQLKSKLKLPTGGISFYSEMQKESRDCLDDIIKNSAENIIRREEAEEVYKLISSGFSFPKYVDILSVSENNENSFWDSVTRIHFDKNKNISKKQKGIKQEERNCHIYNNYTQVITLPYLHYILVFGIKYGKLTFENFIEYLSTKSWIGKPHSSNILSGEENSINWIELLRPSIAEFFIQIQGWVNGDDYKPSFVLCVDSLTLKFEGLLRDFCAKIGIPTSVNRKQVMQEAYIHDILHDKTFKQYFAKDDLLLFIYMFSNDSGLNLRNNVAHCFYNYNEYQPDQMFLLIAALLRLAKYDLDLVKQDKKPNI